VRIPDLNLKFVVHHGTILRQQVAGSEELLGPDVILVHRLLKNDVVASTGIAAYALFSQQCVDAMDLDVAALDMRAARETYEYIGDVTVWVHDLDRRWAQEEARRRVFVDEAQALYRFDAATSAPPQVVWEFLTSPGRRTLWQLGVTGVEVIAPGNRRGVGATNHCMHGGGSSIEELLDWRPYDYYTFQNTVQTPMGSVSYVATTELEPTSSGTTIHQRYAAPQTEQQRAVVEQMRPWLDDVLGKSFIRLTELLDAEIDHDGRVSGSA
jgi:hypothetical protein